MILVVGATGVMGRETTRRLLAGGHRVRALTRSPERAADLKRLGAEVVRGDLIDRTSLTRACVGVDRVVAAAHSVMGHGRYASAAVDDAGHRVLVDCARAAGVRHFVYTSAQRVRIDHPIDFYRSKSRIERHLQDSGLSHTILRPSAFMEWHAHNLLGKSVLENRGAIILGRGNNPMNFIAGRDVACYAVVALTDERAAGRILEIGGPDNPTKNEVAELYGLLSGHQPKVRRIPVAAMRATSAVLRPFLPAVSRALTFGIWGDTTDQTFDPSAMIEEFPVSLTTIEDFVRERVAEART